MSKRKFDESLHSSIADDVVVAVDGGGAEYYEEHQSSTSDDNLLVHRRLAKKARCHTLNDEGKKYTFSSKYNFTMTN